ncbi:MAG: SHOCT domain-containing protein [bacterium]
MNLLSPTVAATLLPLADMFDGHHDWDGGWWVVMALGMLIFWGVVIAGGVWLVRELAERRSRRDDHPAALEVLDRRLAEGAISIEEYSQRRRALLDANRRDDTGG